MDRRAPIDVWDVATFDAELRSLLDARAQLIRDYRTESERLFNEREAQTLRGPPAQNIHGPAFSALREEIAALMAERTIRAWHFTRLAEHEVAAVRKNGLQPMTLALIAERLEAARQAGLIDAELATQLYEASPYHRQIEGNRENRIWLTAQPYPLDDSGVEELLDRWGGESISFVHREGATLERLMQLGTPCVIEVALPMRITTRVEEAATNVLDAFAQSIGVDGGWGGGADMVAVEPIAPEWILAIHSEGEPSFEAMGRGYPPAFTGRDW